MTMAVHNLLALHDIVLNQSRLTQIKRDELAPLLKQPNALTQYADTLIQQQNQQLLSNTITSAQALSQVIHRIIVQLNQSKKYLGQKKYNFIQRWLGIDLEQQVGSLQYLNELNALIDEAALLGHRVATEIHQSQENLQSLHDLRTEMAHYVVAAEQFLLEIDQFAKQQYLDDFKPRIQKKINTLMTSQTATDLAMLQMQLSQNVAMTILDRFNDFFFFFFPAWQQHVFNLQSVQTPQELQRLNEARERLIQTLDHAIKSANN
ncbi:hypothetical protein GWI33_011465 [Rhynchophorus ferrugineus]|uniref:Tellurium resistance protein n=1 Tax=Rhynchophorus ferrugineus TaxID=354439 RepID=A0A834IA61_RHYFE|nr:hypothetical protein GWI33_011465 [Rhynchophorus ferrugineus]